MREEYYKNRSESNPLLRVNARDQVLIPCEFLLLRRSGSAGRGYLIVVFYTVVDGGKIYKIENVSGQNDHECPKTCLVVMVVLAHGNRLLKD